MLVLTRAKEEAIMIGHQIEVKILDVRGDRVRVGIVAPAEVAVHRKEVYLSIQRENLEAAKAQSEGLSGAVTLYKRRGGSSASEDTPGSHAKNESSPEGPGGTSSECRSAAKRDPGTNPAGSDR